MNPVSSQAAALSLNQPTRDWSSRPNSSETSRNLDLVIRLRQDLNEDSDETVQSAELHISDSHLRVMADVTTRPADDGAQQPLPGTQVYAYRLIVRTYTDRVK